jgi:hypothetical protein
VFLVNTGDSSVARIAQHLAGGRGRDGVTCVPLHRNRAGCLLRELGITSPFAPPPLGWTTLVSVVSARAFGWSYVPYA